MAQHGLHSPEEWRCLEEHTASAAIRCVVTDTVSVGGKGADVVNSCVQDLLLASTGEYTFRKRPVEHGGKQSENVEI